jgi:hypothetical protein
MFTVTLLTTSELTGLLLLFATLGHSQPSVYFARDAVLLGARITVSKTVMAWHLNTEMNSALCGGTIRVQSYKAIANWKMSAFKLFPPNHPPPPPKLFKENGKGNTTRNNFGVANVITNN